jgi:hypothetical protein
MERRYKMFGMKFGAELDQNWTSDDFFEIKIKPERPDRFTVDDDPETTVRRQRKDVALVLLALGLGSGVLWVHDNSHHDPSSKQPVLIETPSTAVEQCPLDGPVGPDTPPPDAVLVVSPSRPEL